MLQEQVNLRSWFPVLDGLRCVAVLFVMFGHWLPIEPYTVFFRVYLPGMGVNLFFVLSGFLITRILLVQKLNYQLSGWPLFRSFYARRMLRIFPLYFAVLLAGIILSVPLAREAGWKLASFTLNIPDTQFSFQPADLYNHFWSLCAEEQYYLLFPILLIITPVKKLRWLFIIMLAAGPLSRFLIYTTSFPAYTKEWAANNMTVSCFDCFAGGSLLAWYYCFKPDLLKKLVNNKVVIILVIVFFAVMSYLKITGEANMIPNLFWRLSIAVIASFFIGGLLLKSYPAIFTDILSNKFIVYTGRISFGIYVFHNFMPWVVKQLGWYHPDFHYSVIIYALLYAILTIGMAALSWHFFEKPLMRLKRKFAYKGE